MVATVSVHLCGGLGNRMFMMAAAYGLAVSTGRDATIAGADESAHSGRTYVNTIFADFVVDDRSRGDVQVNVIEPSNRCLAYDGPPTVPLDASVFLTGYFQNERYLEGNKDGFLQRLNLPRVCAEPGAMFIHVRRGDYLRNHFHAVDLSGYFARAVELATTTFGERFQRLLAFSDDPAWCRTHLSRLVGGGVDVEVANEPDEECAMARMAACELGGICANSSFSWWGAYIGFAPGKLVTFPKVWFNHPPSNDPCAGVYVDDIAFSGSVRVG